MMLPPLTTIDTGDALIIGQFLSDNFEALAAYVGDSEADRLIMELNGRPVDDFCEGTDE